MNILDENIIESQRRLLRSWHISIRQIGYEVGRQGLQDDEIIPLLHGLRRPTFFTRDVRFFTRDAPHDGYCIVTLAVGQNEAASFIRRLLRHPEFATKARRTGTIMAVSHVGIRVRRLHVEGETEFFWPRL